jgi:hypothetical protein
LAEVEASPAWVEGVVNYDRENAEVIVLELWGYKWVVVDPKYRKGKAEVIWQVECRRAGREKEYADDDGFEEWRDPNWRFVMTLIAYG